MNRVKQNLIYQIAYRTLTVLTPLITVPIVSRALGAEKLGVYSATMAFATYFMFLAMLGIESYGQRTIAAAASQEEKQKLFWEIFAVQFVSSTISIGAYLATVLLTGGARTAILLLQGLHVLSCLMNIGWFFFGCGEFRVTVTRSFVVKVITIICVVLFVRRPEDLALYTLIMAGGTVLSELVLWISLFRRIRYEKPAWSGIKVHITPILKLFIPVIALSIYHIMDKTMLDVLSTEANVGWYYAVDKIVYIPLSLIMAVGTVMMTRMSYALHNESREQTESLLSKSTELTMFLTCAVMFGIAAISREFIPFFFGPGFEPCVELMLLFLPVLAIKALGDVVRTQYLIPSEKDNIYLAAVTTGAITNVVFNLLLIPAYGAKGAVLGTLAAEGAVFAVQIAGCRKEVHFIRIFAKQPQYFIIGAVMLAAVRICARTVVLPKTIFRILLMVAVGAAVYLLQCVLLWRVKTDSIFSGYVRGRRLDRKD